MAINQDTKKIRKTYLFSTAEAQGTFTNSEEINRY